jgi:hypothetical protein
MEPSRCQQQERLERSDQKGVLGHEIEKSLAKVKKNIISHNKRLIGNTWVFKKKKDGRYRARLCALDYSQKPGEDFIDVSSPVVDDVTVRTVISNMLARGW